MPKSQKPIIAIITSPEISFLNLNKFIDANHIGAIVSGGETVIDSIIEQWTKQNKKEWICYLPQTNLYKEDANDRRNEDMINFCDVVLFFWNGKSQEIIRAIKYCNKLNRKYICHLIKELD